MTQFVRVWPTLPREPRMRHRPTLDADIPSLADIFPHGRHHRSDNPDSTSRFNRPSTAKKNSRLRWRAGHSALAACAWQADQRSKLAMHQSKRRTKRTHPSGTYRGCPSTTHGSGGAWAPSSIAWCSTARQCCGRKGDQHRKTDRRPAQRHTKCTAAIWVAKPRGPLHRPPSGHHPCQHSSHQADFACAGSGFRHSRQGWVLLVSFEL